MLRIPFVRDNKDQVIAGLEKRNINATELINELLDLDEQKRLIQHDSEAKQNEANKLAKEIGEYFKSGRGAEAQKLKEQSVEIKESLKTLTAELSSIENKLHEALLHVPNVPSEFVPSGTLPEHNEVIFEWGKPANKEFPHWDLTNKYKLIDFELGNKITGAGFPVYLGKGARLQRALISFFLDEAVAAGYTEIQPPLLINQESGMGTGQLPDKEGQMYHVTEDNLYLIPTAEVPLTNIYRDCILEKEELPVKICGYTPCFRREAGSYGKDVRGLNRLHQFDKVEIVQIQEPENSYQVLDQMVEHAQNLLKKLELPFRTLKLCGGDMGFTSALTYDLEVFSAGQNRWLEVSSVSNFETFQSNRLKLRYRKEKGAKPELAHTLNGSALALPRILAALLEHNQSDAGIVIPKALVPYCGFDIINE